MAVDNSLRKWAPLEEVCDIDVDMFGIAKPQVVCLKMCESMRVCTDPLACTGLVCVAHAQVDEAPHVYTYIRIQTAMTHDDCVHQDDSTRRQPPWMPSLDIAKASHPVPAPLSGTRNRMSPLLHQISPREPAVFGDKELLERSASPAVRSNLYYAAPQYTDMTEARDLSILSPRANLEVSVRGAWLSVVTLVYCCHLKCIAWLQKPALRWIVANTMVLWFCVCYRVL